MLGTSLLKCKILTESKPIDMQDLGTTDGRTRFGASDIFRAAGRVLQRVPENSRG